MVTRLIALLANQLKRREEDRIEARKDRHLWTQIEALTGAPRRQVDRPRLRLVKRQRLH